MAREVWPQSAEAAMSEARAIALGVWLADHRDKCGCDEPDSAFCAHPVPFEHTPAEMERALAASCPRCNDAGYITEDEEA